MGLNYIALEFNSVLGHNRSSHNVGLFLGIFIFVFLNNFLGLFPYIFTRRRHLVFTLTLGLPLWLGHNLISWYYQPKYCLAHLVPMGTPLILINFIFCIEVLRSLIRPLTLSIRLIANITAGHLLFSLLRVDLIFSVFSLKIYFVLIIYLILIILELGVSIIQAYVFSLLSCLYVKEHLTLELENK